MKATTVGESFLYERMFTVEEVRQFTEISRDKGIHHVIPDDKDRLVVHGLLTTTILTEFGGENNFMARNVNLQFLRPVYTGDLISCVITLDQYDRHPIKPQYQVKTSFIGKNQDGKEVATGYFEGVIFARD
ncbi:enoyl-CoA hydratase [Kurthia sibirica]|uniref:Enoyl-CoA hydratase n=1 Tax=Kurthia sibirica TaxID=202750 RepID=A0A2U3APE2_9BACL|nr:enoyl-CoA hydratase [Kurthia sibirica]PWI26379.1 enoyl-CoA hydratase [Kurthia sibirica]GEK34186.1 enoyl-CoA hydratase [Kurthia sibirica]